MIEELKEHIEAIEKMGWVNRAYLDDECLRQGELVINVDVRPDKISPLEEELQRVARDKSKGCFDWEKAKENLIETDCGITLCRDDYFEGDKKHFTFNEALKIEKEAKKHGLRLPTAADFVKLYAFYGLGEDGVDTPRRFVDKLGFSCSGRRDDMGSNYDGSNGYYWSSSVYDIYDGYYLYFSSSNVYSQGSDDKDYGLAIKFIYDPDESRVLRDE